MNGRIDRDSLRRIAGDWLPGLFILAAVALIASQEFWLADLAAPGALRAWWVDAPFHITNIELVAAVLGGQPLEPADGVSTGFYHFLSYIPAALVSVVTGGSAMTAFAYIYVPLGFLLFAVGIWWLAARFWGREVALWATVMLMALPDVLPYLATSHEFFRLKWLLAVSPGLGYGVFGCALAWLLTLHGIGSQRPGYVAGGWLVCGVTLLVKAHLFVANALPLALYTVWRYPGPRWATRAGLMMALVAVYLLVVAQTRHLLGVPLIHYDLSNAANYAAILGRFPANDLVSPTLLRWVSEASPLLAALALAGSLLYLHFGALFIAALGLLRTDIKLKQGGRWAVPLFLLSAYVINAVVLAQDSRPYRYSGESIELLHRPFVWAVALFMVWTIAAIASRYPQLLRRGVRWTMVLILLPLMLHNYGELQFSPRWEALRLTYGDDYYRALAWVANARHDKIVQTADLDPFFVARALTGSRPYVLRYAMRAYPDPEVAERVRRVDLWFADTDPERITAFAREAGITWLVVDDVARLAWPSAYVARQTIHTDGGARVIALEGAPELGLLGRGMREGGL